MTTTQPTLEQLLAPIREHAVALETTVEKGNVPGVMMQLAAFQERETLLAALDAVVARCGRIVELAPQPDEFSEDVGLHYDMGRADLAADLLQAAQSALAKGGE